MRQELVDIENEGHWTGGEKIYVYLTTDTNGFAKVRSVSKEEPADKQIFLKAKVSYITGGGTNKLIIDYPFDRFYMEESKANEAELLYRQLQRDTSKTAYALVSVKNGDAVLKDVLIGGTSIRELVKANQKEK